MRNFKDESFIQQFLTPKLIEEFSFFTILDDERNEEYVVEAIHNDAGYRTVRDVLANSRNLSTFIPELQVVDVRKNTDRALVLKHSMVDGRPLDQESTLQVLKHLEFLWGFPVDLTSYHGDAIYSSITIADSEPSVSVFLNDKD
ncbi:SpoVR family protein [compost metagenome]